MGPTTAQETNLWAELSCLLDYFDLWAHLWAIIYIRLIEVGRVTLTVGDTVPWPWVLDCKRRTWAKHHDSSLCFLPPNVLQQRPHAPSAMMNTPTGEYKEIGGCCTAFKCYVCLQITEIKQVMPEVKVDAVSHVYLWPKVSMVPAWLVHASAGAAFFPAFIMDAHCIRSQICLKS